MSDGASNRHYLSRQALEAHFGEDRIATLIGSRREFNSHLKPDIDKAIREALEGLGAELLGIDYSEHYESLTLSRLLSRKEHSEVELTPLEYQEIDVGDDQPFHVVRTGLWLFRSEDQPLAVVLSDYFEGDHRFTVVEVIHEATRSAFKTTLFENLEQAAARAALYRGKILSFERWGESGGLRSDIRVHRIEPVGDAQVILDPDTRRRVQSSIFAFDAQREGLRRLGQATRKGVLLFGPPGTGKTHTIQHIITNLPDRTTLLVIGEQMGQLRRYIGLAKALQPSIVVLEDVDLIGRNRDQNSAETLLNELLNLMDGLDPQAEILFILTTNRPEAIEPALANRPGRIDVAIEVPLPDHDCRRRLIALYGAALDLPEVVVTRASDKTDGASAAYMKEFVRRLAQLSLEDGRKGAVTADDVDAIVADTIDNSTHLGRRAIGFGRTRD